jgi:hypothetical protein
LATVEVGVELALTTRSHVEVELGGHALAVVVGGLEHRRVLDRSVPSRRKPSSSSRAPARAGSAGRERG